MTRSQGEEQEERSSKNHPHRTPLAFVIRIEPPPPHLFQPEFKAHRRKPNGPASAAMVSAMASETPAGAKVSKPSSLPIATAAAASSTSSRSPARAPPHTVKRPPPPPPPPQQAKLPSATSSSSPKRQFGNPNHRQTKSILNRPPAVSTSSTTTNQPRPKSMFEIDQRLPRDWYQPTQPPRHNRPRSLTPTNISNCPVESMATTAPIASARTHQIRQDNSGIASTSSSSSPSSRVHNRSVPTTRLPLFSPSYDTAGASSSVVDSSSPNGNHHRHSQRQPGGDQTQLPSSSSSMVAVAKETVEESSAGSRILIKGGQVVNDDAITLADVFLEDGIIKQVGPNLAVPGGARVIEAKGKYVLPGGIDTNTHFQLPFMGTTSIDDYYSGTKAAVAGGTTMIIGSALPQRGESLMSAYEKWRGWADPKVCCDYGLSVGVTHWSEKVGDEMVQLASKGVNSFKFFMGYKDTYMLRDEELYRGFQHCKRVGAVARVHAENGDLVAMKQKDMLAAGVTGPEGHLQAHTEEAEIEATARACILARQANCPLYILNVTSKGAADAIGDAKRKGSVVFGESIAAALATDGGHYFDKSWRHAASYVTAPPLRLDSSTPKCLMQSLAGGDLHIAASAHRAYTSNQKLAGKDDFTKIPHGVNGAEERMMVLWEKGVNTGKLDPMRFVAVTSTNAAKTFNIYPKKGRIAEGSDADVVIWDAESSKTISTGSHNSQSDLNIFEGLTCNGIPYVTIAGGRVVYEDGQVHVTQGAGKYVPLPPNSPYVFSAIGVRDRAMRPLKVDRSGAVSPKASLDNGSSQNNKSANQSNNNSKAASPQLPRRSNEQPYMEPLMPATSKKNADDEFHSRPLTKGGSRNMQDSTFAISGAQADDNEPGKRSTRVSNPPGGKSAGLW